MEELTDDQKKIRQILNIINELNTKLNTIEVNMNCYLKDMETLIIDKEKECHAFVFLETIILPAYREFKNSIQMSLDRQKRNFIKIKKEGKLIFIFKNEKYIAFNEIGIDIIKDIIKSYIEYYDPLINDIAINSINFMENITKHIKPNSLLPYKIPTFADYLNNCKGDLNNPKKDLCKLFFIDDKQNMKYSKNDELVCNAGSYIPYNTFMQLFNKDISGLVMLLTELFELFKPDINSENFNRIDNSLEILKTSMAKVNSEYTKIDILSQNRDIGNIEFKPLEEKEFEDMESDWTEIKNGGSNNKLMNIFLPSKSKEFTQTSIPYGFETTQIGGNSNKIISLDLTEQQSEVYHSTESWLNFLK